MRRTKRTEILVVAVAVIGLAVAVGVVVASGNAQQFTSWQAAFDHLAGRVANVESKVSNLESEHSIVCSTLLADYNAGHRLFTTDTAQESHDRGIGKVEDYLDSATSGTHYETRWTRAGAEAEYNRCTATSQTPSTPVPTQLPSTPVPTQTQLPSTPVPTQSPPIATLLPVSTSPSAGYGDWRGRQHDCPASWSSCIQDTDDEYVLLFAHTHNSTFVAPGGTNILPHTIRIDCEANALGQTRAWADFVSFGYDIYDATPSFSVQVDGGAATTYTGHKLFSDTNEGLYLTPSDTQEFYQQIRNANEVVITSTADGQNKTARAEFTVTGVTNAINTLSCWSQASVPAASLVKEASIRLDTPAGIRMDALDAAESMTLR